eukprot:Pgem_evm1s11987
MIILYIYLNLLGLRCELSSFENTITGHYVIDEKSICRDCAIETAFCGDGNIEPIRGEQCDPPYSQGGGLIEGGTAICNDQCQVEYGTVCQKAVECSECDCTTNTSTCQLKIEQTESPPGFG